MEGPIDYERERADGTLVEWELSFLGDEAGPGATLPFLISDRTPRELRVQPTGDLTTSPITSVETVVLAVPDLEIATDRFRMAFDLGPPSRKYLDHFDADVAVFADAPVALVTPNGDGWLADRLDQFGPRPVAYLLGIDADAKSPFEATATETLDGRTVDWIPPTEPIGRPYIGVIMTNC